MDTNTAVTSDVARNTIMTSLVCDQRMSVVDCRLELDFPLRKPTAAGHGRNRRRQSKSKRKCRCRKRKKEAEFTRWVGRWSLVKWQSRRVPTRIACPAVTLTFLRFPPLGLPLSRRHTTREATGWWETKRGAACQVFRRSIGRPETEPPGSLAAPLLTLDQGQ